MGVALALASTSAVALAKPGDEAKQALVLFERGKVAYKEGRFGDSVLLLQEAYSLKAEPVLLYNIGRAQEANGDLAKAIASYDRYLATAPDAPDRAEVQAKRDALEAKLAEAQRAADASAAAERQAKGEAQPTRDAKAPEDETPSVVPWVVAGSGAAVVVGGVVLGVLALGKNGDADEAVTQRGAAEQRDSAETFALASTITFIAGGAILAAGTTWGVIDLVSASPSDAAASRPGGRSRMALRLRGAGASLDGAF